MHNLINSKQILREVPNEKVELTLLLVTFFSEGGCFAGSSVFCELMKT